MAKPRAPVCTGIKSTGLHMAKPGEQLVKGLCAECRAELKGGRK